MIYVIMLPPVRSARVVSRKLLFTLTLIVAATVVVALGALVSRAILRPSVVAVGLVGILAIGSGLREEGVIRFPAVSRDWQVPKGWMERYGFWGGAALYGATLGTGFMTRTPFLSYHVMALATLAFATVPQALVIGCVYGIARAGASWLAARLILVEDRPTPHLVQTITASAPALHVVNSAALLCVGAALVTHALVGTF